jgi:dipeptide transport system permease protein
VLVQYGFYLSRLLHGDLGRRSSPRAGDSEFFTLFPATIELSLCAMSSRCCSACRPASSRRSSATRGSTRRDGRCAHRLFDADLLVGPAADPASSRCISAGRRCRAASRLQYFIEPVTGFMLIDSLLSGEKGAFRSALSHLILPTIVLGTIPLAVIARMTRSAMLEVLGEDYIRTARAKGLSPLSRRRRPCAAQRADPGGHRDRPAGRRAAHRRDPDRDDLLLAGHRQMADRGDQPRDYPVLQGGTAADRARRHGVNLLVDVLYGVINPRIRHCMMSRSHETPKTRNQPSPPPHPLREFWHYFSPQQRRVAASSSSSSSCCWRSSPDCSRRIRPNLSSTTRRS